MKRVHVGMWPFPVLAAHRIPIPEWLNTLPKMARTGSPAYSYSKSATTIIFKRDEDATAFKLRFGL